MDGGLFIERVKIENKLFEKLLKGLVVFNIGLTGQLGKKLGMSSLRTEKFF